MISLPFVNSRAIGNATKENKFVFEFAIKPQAPPQDP
ncbi:hypothetical protein AWB69_03402 [Caballeronia udeis]|uniref:Uncharacterized protein n=1 Tax=Caballeronia udeis TaxID=1232866 RepID=A0A158GVY6_9BURK|nr:hypothetical protein AWB69_03402 [Caballeronia udeis]